MSRHSTPRPLHRLRLLVGVVVCAVIFTFAPTIAQAAFVGSAQPSTIRVDATLLGRS